MSPAKIAGSILLVTLQPRTPSAAALQAAGPATQPAVIDVIPRRLTHVVHAYANFGPRDESIVFQSNATGNWDLYAMRADGTGMHAVVTHPAADITPVYSPDGSKIAFVSERDGNREVYVCDADGANPTRLTNEPGHDIHPVWSSDGQRILFSSNRGNDDVADYDIYEMNGDGSGVKRITSGPDVDTYASWSPDGERIVTRRVIGTNNEVFVMDADGSNAVNLTNDPSRYDGWPVWSPDGRRIAFASGVPGRGNHAIFLIDPDGRNRLQLTHPLPGLGEFMYNTQPAFSRDGKRLVFTMYRPTLHEDAELTIIDLPPDA